jgi:hypothetical protein
MSETTEKINRQYTYIVENIKFIYKSFDKFFLPVSQRVKMNYIFFDNIRNITNSFSLSFLPLKNAKYIRVVNIILALI